jgi:hypothetical protein
MADFDKITAGARKALGQADQLFNKADPGRIWTDDSATEPLSAQGGRQTSAKAVPNSHSSSNLNFTTTSNSLVRSDSHTYSDPSIHPASNTWLSAHKRQSKSTSMALRPAPAFLSGDPLDESASSDGSAATAPRRISTMQSDYFHLKARGIVADAHGLTRKRVSDHDDGSGARRRLGSDRGDGERPELTAERAREMVAAALATPGGGAEKRARLLGSSGAAASGGAAAFTPRSAGAKRPAKPDEVDELIERSRRARAALNDTMSYYREERLRLEEDQREMPRPASSSGSSGGARRSFGSGMRHSFGSGAFGNGLRQSFGNGDVVGGPSLAGGNSVEDAIEL